MLTLVARRGECTAGELGRPFDIAQPTASKHLRVLEQAGLLVRAIDGREHRFKVAPRPLDDAERWLTRHRRFWHGSLARLGSLLQETDDGD